jgi:3-methyladenine DNA glycosylase/8-oxoguanine DNA glycosylase
MQITSPSFGFDDLVLAHGWVNLAPFSWEADRRILRTVIKQDNSKHVSVAISVRARGDRSIISARIPDEKALNSRSRMLFRKTIRRVLCLDLDFTEFHRMAVRAPELCFAARRKLGPMLRSATAFEDLVKTVCTTNCDWRNTKNMCIRLCELGSSSFPTPEMILKLSPDELSRRVPLGYRTETIRTIARLTLDGKLPLDKWASDATCARIKKALREIPGVGTYCINHMLVLLGYYADIPVDCEVLKYLRDTHFGGKPVSAKIAVEPFDKYGEWKFLAYKCERIGRRLNYIDKD